MSSEHVDFVKTTPSSSDLHDPKDIVQLESGDSVSAEVRHQEKGIMRKVDRRLLPLCGALYAVSLVDRLNLPNARLAGMDEALGMSIGNRYSVVTMVFFIGYIVFDFPAGFVMRKTGAATFLGVIGFCWGILTIAMGFCKTWGALLACRVIFGALEGGLFREYPCKVADTNTHSLPRSLLCISSQICHFVETWEVDYHHPQPTHHLEIVLANTHAHCLSPHSRYYFSSFLLVHQA